MWNTSYPLSPQDWAAYRTREPLSFAHESALSYYIHIPFCQHLCAFCEYSRMHCPDEIEQTYYLDIIERDIFRFSQDHRHVSLQGFDLGGGTPTALSDENFRRLLHLIRTISAQHPQTDDYEPSIEATFSTLSDEKIKMIVQAGFRRVSLGLQSSNLEVLRHNHRPSSAPALMSRVLERLRTGGVEKVNLDIMYGLAHQTIDTLQYDIALLKFLLPEQITLYELRTNQLSSSSSWSKDMLFEAYVFLFDTLREMGYHARFGQNTFSKFSTDLGVSSYLRHRMTEAAPYKGFGLSAQSMCREGVSYNRGKNANALSKLVRSDTYEGGDTYFLPPLEIAAKYIAISAYFGGFSMDRLIEIVGEEARSYYAEALDFCLSHRLITIDGDEVRITRRGFRDYGAVFSLFYSPR